MSSRLTRLGGGWLLAGVLALVAPAGASAATFSVNTTADTVTANGCAPGNPNTCSLREAVIEANATAGADTITLPAGTYQLTIAPAAGADPHDSATGDLDITDALSIVGADSATTIVEAGPTAGSGIDKVFSINPQGVPRAGFDVSLSGMTIRFGKNNSASGTGDGFGGALDFNAGSDGAGNLTLSHDVITDNATTDGDGGGIAAFSAGGTGKVTISDSTVQNNVANTSTTGTAGVGGGLDFGPFMTFSISHSQILNNQAPQTTGARGSGGGIYAANPGFGSSITDSIVAGNQAAGDGGGLASFRGLSITGGAIGFNTAGGNGGGILLNTGVEDFTTLTASTISGNGATGNGGGIHNSSGVLMAHYNRIVDNGAAAGWGLNAVTGQIDATDNWWGCNEGPSSAPCDTVSDPNLIASFDPWLTLSHTPNPATIAVGASSTLTASFLQDNHGGAVSASNLSAFEGLPIQFNNPVLGTLSASNTSISGGKATATYTANGAGAGHADAVVDSATVTADITNAAPPSIAKAFAAASILVNSSTSLTFTITNSNVSAALTGVGFTDPLPSGLVVASPNGLTVSCGGGSITAVPGSGSVSLAGATIRASGSCTFSVNVAATSVGNQVNVTGAVSSTNGGTGNTATASINVTGRPAISQAFGAPSIPLGGSTSLSFVITNPNSGAGPTLHGVGFVDTLPSGLVVATPNALSGSCGGGTITATAGSGSVTLSGASLAGGASCTFSVNVTGTSAGARKSTTTVTSTDGGTGNTANASLEVIGAPSASIAAPANDQSFHVGQLVTTSFSCAEATGGPGIKSCVDSGGRSAPQGTLDTSAVGSHTYTVTATSTDGLTASSVVHYTVTPCDSFTLDRVKAHPGDGSVTLSVTVDCPGSLDTLETAWNSALKTPRALLQPGPDRFALARMHVRAAHAATVTMLVKPNARGHNAVALAHRTHRPLIVNVWVLYTPEVGRAITHAKLHLRLAP
jgi:CSLREA domain-containing protein